MNKHNLNWNAESSIFINGERVGDLNTLKRFITEKEYDKVIEDIVNEQFEGEVAYDRSNNLDFTYSVKFLSDNEIDFKDISKEDRNRIVKQIEKGILHNNEKVTLQKEQTLEEMKKMITVKRNREER